MRKFVDQLRTRLATNPFAWFLFVLLLAAVYGNYKLGKQLTGVCNLTSTIVATNPIYAKKIEAICTSRDAALDDE